MGAKPRPAVERPMTFTEAWALMTRLWERRRQDPERWDAITSLLDTMEKNRQRSSNAPQAEPVEEEWPPRGHPLHEDWQPPEEKPEGPAAPPVGIAAHRAARRRRRTTERRS